MALTTGDSVAKDDSMYCLQVTHAVHPVVTR